MHKIEINDNGDTRDLIIYAFNKNVKETIALQGSDEFDLIAKILYNKKWLN